MNTRLGLLFVVGMFVVVCIFDYTIIREQDKTIRAQLRQIQNLKQQQSLEKKITMQQQVLERNVLINTLASTIYNDSSKTSTKLAREIATCIVTHAKDIPLTTAVFYVESTFNITSVSSANALGLAQITSVHFDKLKGLGVIKDSRDLFDPCVAVKAFNVVMGDFLKATKGDVEKALYKYLGANSNGYGSKVLSYRKKISVLVRSVKTAFKE